MFRWIIEAFCPACEAFKAGVSDGPGATAPLEEYAQGCERCGEPVWVRMALVGTDAKV